MKRLACFLILFTLHSIAKDLPIHQIIEIDELAYLVSMITDDTNTVSYRTYPFSEINFAGFYKLATQVTNQITINSNDVMLDLGGQNVAGGIVVQSGLENITISNGTVDASVSNAIEVQSGCKNITIQNLKAKNASRGILFDQISESCIKNCELTSNDTGIALCNSNNILVENCTANANIFAGFDLVSSVTCSFLNCKAIATGTNNTTVINNTVTGFISNNGHGNIFQRCIANSTQALLTTDSQSIIAGFALRGTEGCSKIINCGSSNATTSPTGVTVPYGIMLEAQVDSNLTLTASPQIPAFSDIEDISWSPDMKYLVEGRNNGDVLLYKFDSKNFIFTQVDSDADTSSQARNVVFDPSGQYVASIPYPSSQPIYIYRVDTFNDKLNLVAQSSETSLDVQSLAWDPSGNYIAIVEQSGTPPELKVFEFNRVSETIALIDTIDPASGSIITVAWSPDGKYIAVGSESSGLPIETISFINNQLNLIDQAPLNFGPRGMDWSSDGKYIAVGTTNDFEIFSIDSSANLTQVHSFSNGTQTRQAKWSPDGKYFATAGFGSTNVRVYSFDRSTNSTNLVATSASISSITGATSTLEWSPDGRFISLEQFTFEALSFPSNNIIINNAVSCNSGGSIPSGIGISGSSIENLIIGNTSYANPLNPFMVETNYAFVTNVFNPLFQDIPYAQQNIGPMAQVPIQAPLDQVLMLSQLNSKLCDIQSKVDYLIAANS